MHTLDFPFSRGKVEERKREKRGGKDEETWRARTRAMTWFHRQQIFYLDCGRSGFGVWYKRDVWDSCNYPVRNIDQWRGGLNACAQRTEQSRRRVKTRMGDVKDGISAR